MSRGSGNTNDEVVKLQQHLSLLRDQYSLLQERCDKLQHERDVATAAASPNSEATVSFTSRLLRFVGQLHDKAEYSDLQVQVSESKVLRAHKFVLVARSPHWEPLTQDETLDWSSLGAGVGEAVLQWVYNGQLQQYSDTAFLMLLMTAAAKLTLHHLMERCEDAMLGRVTVNNCVKLYTTADEIGATTLRDHCSALISAHWDDFTSEDFSHMSGPLLYAMFKSKTSRPLHAAVRHRREDVLFLYLIEHRAQLPGALEARDDSGSPVLEVALSSGQHSMANTLLEHGASVDTRDATGATLLHRAVARGDEFSATYLLQHGASVNCQERCRGSTPLHVLVTGGCDTPRAGGSCGTHQDPGVDLAQSQHCARPTNYNTSYTNGVTSNSTSENRYKSSARGNHSSGSSSADHSGSVSSEHSMCSGHSNSVGSADSSTASSFTSDQKVKLCTLLLEKGADPNIQDRQKRTVYHCAVLSSDCAVLSAVLQHDPQHLELLDCEGHTALWYALFAPSGSCDTAALLRDHGADLDALVGDNGDTLLHVSCQRGAEKAGLFLVTSGAAVDLTNSSGETALHCCCTTGLPALTAALLQHGSNPNTTTLATVPTTTAALVNSATNLYEGSTASVSSSHSSSNDNTSPSTNPFDDPDTPPPHGINNGAQALHGGGPPHGGDGGEAPHQVVVVPVYKETPLHRAVANANVGDVRAILKHKVSSKSATGTVTANLELRDSNDHTVLGSALSSGLTHVGEELLSAGASIGAIDSQGRSYLHIAVQAGDVKGAAFLLDNGADPNVRDRAGQTPLELCIHGGVYDAALLEQLCRGGAGNVPPGEGGVLGKDPPLWQAMLHDRMDVAALIIKHGADPDWWHDGDSCQQTLLHRAIDDNMEDAAVFLLSSGCDVNSPRRPKGSTKPDQMTPLHLCAAWGLDRTALSLTEHGAKVNVKESDGKTPLHLAIESGNAGVISVLLGQPCLDLSIRDKTGMTPFASAMTRRNNVAAKAILDREPKAAQQFDHKGHNFLHVAVSKADLESVLFLLSIHVDLSTTTRDDKQLNPLHLATITGSELLVRNLLLAGSEINVLTPQKQTVLHLAALHDHSSVAHVLLENRVNYDAVDADLNNALHVAVKNGHMAMARVLLSESDINATAVNLRGQNPLHLLACHQPGTAPTIAKLFLEVMPDYPLDAPDVHGNTALLLSYQRGGSQLCRVLVAAGASLSISNGQGENLFNSAVASRALLAVLLDSLSSEPPWAEGDNCLECGAKFTLATRRHHCRHCGRLLCAKCSDKLLPLLKFALNKPVRVCHICSEVITLGTAALT